MPTRYVNNWLTRLEQQLAADAVTLPVPSGALAKLDLTGGGEYTLSVTNTLEPEAQTVEIMRLTADGLIRAQEGTMAQDWPAGSFVYHALTAAQIEALSQPGGGTASNGFVNILGAGTFSVDARTAYLSITSRYDPGPEKITVSFEPAAPGTAYCLDFWILAAGLADGGRNMEFIVPDETGAWSSFIEGVDPAKVSGSFETPSSYAEANNMRGVMGGRVIVSCDQSGYGAVLLQVLYQNSY